ncbi:MAG: AAA family ATPase [Acidimicrobiales bacterium]|nr:AAA family ATPase [Acidimicrobiales bacterium]
MTPSSFPPEPDDARYPSLATFTPAQWRQVQQTCAAGKRWQTVQRLPEGLEPRTGRLGFEQCADGTWFVFLENHNLYTTVGTVPLLSELVSEGAVALDRIDAAAAFSGSRARRPPVTDLDAILDPAVDAPEPHVPSARLVAQLAESVIGQEVPLTRLARAIATRLSRRKNRRPVFALLHGPTGTGKTLVAQMLSGVLSSETGRPWEFVRLNLNQFSEAHSAMSVLGAPASYVGYGESPFNGLGKFGVLLLDELEKAHRVLWTVLMELFDSGRITLNDGTKVDLSHWIIIGTSNLQLPDDEKAGRRELLSEGLSEAVINRITAIIRFQPLDTQARRRIAVDSLVDLAGEYDLELTWADPQVLSSALADSDPRFGARDIARNLDRCWSEPLAEFAAEAAEGERSVTLSLDDAGEPVVARPQDASAAPIAPRHPDDDEAGEDP